VTFDEGSFYFWISGDGQSTPTNSREVRELAIPSISRLLRLDALNEAVTISRLPFATARKL
jgi:hypothetical protein